MKETEGNMHNGHSSENSGSPDEQKIAQPSDKPNAETEQRGVPSTWSKIPEAILQCLRHYRTSPREKSKGSEIAMVILTVAIASAAFYSACIFQGQLRQMRQSNVLSQQQWRAEHRPWMGISQVSVSGANFSSRRPSLLTLQIRGTITLRNFGTYPAFNVNSEVSTEIPVTGDTITRPPSVSFACNDSAKFGERMVVFPGTSFHTGFSHEMNVGWKNRLVEESRVWLLVCISYKDGSDDFHHTKVWLRSTHALKARWIILNQMTRYLPITGFESWGEQAN